MIEPTDMGEILFVYDGECPMCRSVAAMTKIKTKYGAVRLVDARADKKHPVISEITRRGLDLDVGMVIVAGDKFHHGGDALAFVAQYGDDTGLFGTACRNLFQSRHLTNGIYPCLRWVRNFLLRIRNVGQIENLADNDEPIFKDIFGKTWLDLPPVLRKHYPNRPYSDDRTVAVGEMDVACAGPVKFFAPIAKLLGQIPATNETNVPVNVTFRSDPNSRAFHFERIFKFRNDRPYAFCSRMVGLGNGDVVEIMRFGLSWKLRYHWDGEKVILLHRGYALHLLGWFIPMPLTFLLGKGHAEETAIDDRTFDMIMHLSHPWWGRIYTYHGRFQVMEET